MSAKRRLKIEERAEYGKTASSQIRIKGQWLTRAGFPPGASVAIGGRLVALCSNGSKQRDELTPLCSQWIDLPAGSFKDSGTSVNVAMIVIEKESA